MNLTDRPGTLAQQSIIHIVWLKNNQIEQKLILWIRGPFKVENSEMTWPCSAICSELYC